MNVADIYFTSEEGGQLSIASSTVWILNGKCSRCGAEGDVMDADPEQAGYGTPICQSCINALFGELQLRRMEPNVMSDYQIKA